MISEAIDMPPPNKVIAYETGSMNEVHKAHLISELAMGRISILKEYSHLRAPSLNSTASTPTKPPLPAAMVIAQKIWGKLTKEDRP